MFSEQLRQEAELRFQRQLPYFGQRKAEILCQMGQCSEEDTDEVSLWNHAAPGCGSL